MTDPARRKADGDAAVRLDFEIEVDGGRGVLLLRPCTLFGWLRVERLDLEIPGVRFPLDITKGINQFQRDRCDVSGAQLTLEASALPRYAHARARALEAAGFDHVVLRAEAGGLEITARTRVGAQHADILTRVAIVAEGRKVRLTITEAQLFGPLRRPAPVVAHDLLCVLSGAASAEIDDESGTAQVRALGVIELMPLELFLWWALPRAGWRLPAPAAPLARLRATANGLEIDYGKFDVGAAEPPAVAEPRSTELAAVDQALLASDFDGAVAACRTAMAKGNDPRRVTERLLSVLVARDSTMGSAEAVALNAAQRFPDLLAPRLALATLSQARGEIGEAMRHFQAAEAASSARGDDGTAAMAALACARALGRDPRSTALLERVLALRPGHPEATGMLAASYRETGRFADLVALLRHRITAAPDAGERARHRLMIAELSLDKLGDAQTARTETEAVLAATPNDERASELYTRALLALGDRAAAIQTLERAAERHAKKKDAVEEARAHARLGALYFEIGDDDHAHAAYRKALELAPDDVAALEAVTCVAARRGLIEEAQLGLNRLLALRAEPARLRKPRRELAQLLEDLGDLAGARALLTAATPSDDDALLALAALEQRAGRLPAALDALAQAAARVTGAAAAAIELERATMLESLGRGDEASEQRARAYALDPNGPAGEEAARELGAAARGRGDDAEEARWLDALLSRRESPDVKDLIDRGELSFRRAELLADTDPARAARLLGEAIDGGLSSRVARHRYADLLGRTGEPARQVEILEGLLDGAKEAERIDLLVKLAGAARQSGDTDAALARAKEAAAADPTRIDAKEAIAEASWQARAWDEVIASYQEIVPHVSGAVRAAYTLRLGIAMERHGRIDDAIGVYVSLRDAVDAGGEPLVSCYRRMVEANDRLGSWERAAEILVQWADDPRTEEDEVARATLLARAAVVMHRRLGESSRAETLLRRALESVPEHAAALDALESVLAESGRQAEVAEVLWEKASAAPDPLRRRELLARIVDIADKLGRPDLAEQAKQWLTVMDPHARAVEPPAPPAPAAPPAPSSPPPPAPSAQPNLSPIARLQRDLAATPRDHVTEATELRLQLGLLHAREGHDDDARLLLERVVADEPSRVAAVETLARLYEAAGDWILAAEALGKLWHLLLEDPERAETLYRMGEIFELHLGDDERASDAYLKAIDIEPTHVPTMRRLVDYFWGTGDLESLIEMAEGLFEQAALPDSDPRTLAQIALTSGLRGESAAAARAARLLGAEGSDALAIAAAEVAARSDLPELARLLRFLCAPPGPAAGAVRSVLAQKALRDPRIAELVRLLG